MFERLPGSSQWNCNIQAQIQLNILSYLYISVNCHDFHWSEATSLHKEPQQRSPARGAIQIQDRERSVSLIVEDPTETGQNTI